MLLDSNEYSGTGDNSAIGRAGSAGRISNYDRSFDGFSDSNKGNGMGIFPSEAKRLGTIGIRHVSVTNTQLQFNSSTTILLCVPFLRLHRVNLSNLAVNLSIEISSRMACFGGQLRKFLFLSATGTEAEDAIAGVLWHYDRSMTAIGPRHGWTAKGRYWLKWEMLGVSGRMGVAG